MCNIPAVVTRYENVPEYAEAMRRLGLKDSALGGTYSSWCLDVTHEEALDQCVKGDPNLVSGMTEAIHKVSSMAMTTDLRDRFIPSIAGSRVSVPDYLGGSPTCMRRKAKAEVPCRSVCIYVSTTCSAGIGAEHMVKRGASILGLLEYLQGCQISVDLFLLAETEYGYGKDLFQVIRVESRPLDLSTAAFAIAHPAFSRKVTHAAPQAKGWGGSWPHSLMYFGGFEREGQSKEYLAHIRKAVGMQPGDLHIPGTCLWDEAVEKPEKWLAARIEQLGLGGPAI